MRHFAAILVPLTALVSGCGTIANFNGGHYGGMIDGRRGEPERPPFVYGGLLYDIEMLMIYGKKDPEVMAALFPLWLMEFSVSAAFDTATIPLVVWKNGKLVWERTETAKERPADSVSPDPGGPIPPPATPIEQPTAAESVFASQSKR